MKILRREEWIENPDLQKFRWIPPTKDRYCMCPEDSEHIYELIDHESCIVGRIDSVVCVKCNAVKSFSIIR